MTNIKNNMEQRIDRAFNDYCTALSEYALASDAIKCWTFDTDEMTYRHAMTCHGALWRGIENTLKIFLSIPENDKVSLASLCNKTIENKKLDSVDLCCFPTSKEPRNQAEHNSRIVELKGYQRVLRNFYRLLTICFPDKPVKIPPIAENEFDFEKFYNNMGEFKEEFCRYVLICNPVHDVPEAHIQTLMRIPWYIIMDFDGRSNRKGLKSAIDNDEQLQIIHYHIDSINTAGINEGICQSGKTIYVSLEKNNKVIPLEEKIWEEKQKGKKRNISSLITKTYSTRYPKIKLVCLKPFSPELRVIIEQFRDIYGIDNLEVLFLTDVTGDQTALEQTCEHLTIYNSEVTDIFNTVSNYTHLMPRLIKPKEITGIWLPSRNIEPQLINNDVLLENTQINFEILHLGCGKNLEDCDEESFLKGKLATWEVLNLNYDVSLVPPKKYTDFLNNMEDSFVVRPDMNRVFNIIHKPGFGGTTLGRRIAWDLHDRYPVLVLKKYDGVTINRLKQFYDVVKTGTLVLADENSISQSDFEKFEHDIEIINRPIVALCVKRGDPKRKVHSKQTLSLDIIGNEIIESIIQKCSTIALRKNKSDIIEKRRSTMYKVLEGEMLCPLIISLYFLEEDFESLDQYVYRFLKKLSYDSDSEKLKRALRYVALCNYFSTKLLPAAMVKQITTGDQNIRITLNEKLKTVDELLLYADRKTYLGFRHYLIAEEVMRQLFVPEEVEVTKDTWKDYIKEYAIKFIDYLHGQCKQKVDLEIIEIITALFIDKNQSMPIREENTDAKLSPIICDIPDVGDQRISVLRYLADTFHEFIYANVDIEDGRKEYAMLSRIWANCGRYYSRSNLKNFKEADYCCQNALEIMRITNTYDYDIFHMAGLCTYEKAKEEFIHFESVDELETVKNDIEEAMEFFNKTSSYGSPDYGIPSLIRLVSEFTEKVFALYDIDSLECITKIKETWVQQCIASALDIISETDESDFSEKGRTFFIQQTGNLENLCYANGYSKVLEDHNNHLNTLMNAPHKDTVSIALTRRFLIQTLLRKHKNNILELAKNDKDSSWVLRHLEDNMALRNKDSLRSYRLWFKLAKCCNKPTGEGLLKASQWKDLLNEKGQKDPMPFYYLYVLSILSFIEGNISIEDATRYYHDCRKFYGRDNHVNPTKVRDWFSTGKGMGMMFDASLINLEDVPNENKIAKVEGKIFEVDPSGRETYGYIVLGPQSRLSRSELFSKVFFVPSASGITGLQKDKNVTFKFGFSFERLTAFDKSIEVIGADHNTEIDGTQKARKMKRLIYEHPASLVKKTVEFNIDRFLEKGNTRLLLGKLNNRNAAIPSWEVSNDNLGNEELKQYLGQTVQVKVLSYNKNKDNYSLSIKRV